MAAASRIDEAFGGEAERRGKAEPGPPASLQEKSAGHNQGGHLSWRGTRGLNGGGCVPAGFPGARDGADKARNRARQRLDVGVSGASWRRCRVLCCPTMLTTGDRAFRAL